LRRCIRFPAANGQPPRRVRLLIPLRAEINPRIFSTRRLRVYRPPPCPAPVASVCKCRCPLLWIWVLTAMDQFNNKTKPLSVGPMIDACRCQDPHEFLNVIDGALSGMMGASSITPTILRGKQAISRRCVLMKRRFRTLDSDIDGTRF
jgi:hypothetical protein